jgi:8-oxo-dGTP pyrophosphatase MutT (NUDIX family)
MDRILRAEPGWQEAIGEALTRIARPIATDPRLLPRQASAGERPRWDPADFPPPRRAATLLLLYPGDHGELTVPLTVRQPDLRAHAGEVSLPGGAVDPDDPSPRAAALRETWEEIGVPPAAVTLLGTLDEVWIPVSNFRLKPFVGALRERPDLVPHSGEVASIVELPVRLLLDDDAITEHLVAGPGWSLRAGAYRHAEQIIWGATARTLAMFASVLRKVERTG